MGDELSSSDGGLDESVILPSIDFVGFNPYYSAPNALIKSNTNYIEGYVHGINFLRNIMGVNSVPIIISEGGTDEKYMECSNFDLDIVDKMTLPFTGVAGINTWLGYRPNRLEDENDVVTMPNSTYDMWDNTIRVKNHMNGNDVINTLSEGGGYWSHGMGTAERESSLFERYSVEHQYYTSSDRRDVVGYVKNKSFNVHTRGNSGTACSSLDLDNIVTETPRNTEWNDVKNSDRLRVKNLKTHTEYQIDWYSNNQYIKTDCIETNKKDGIWGITLEYPELTVSHTGNNDLPVVWYVIQQQDCSSGMVQQNNIKESEEELNRLQVLNTNKNMEEYLTLYPNPFQYQITIQSLERDEIILKTIEGKVIKSFYVEEGTTKISTNFLSNGVYLLTFVNQSRTFKMIKQ